jgi:Xaa-Pro aminopeptidase
MFTPRQREVYSIVLETQEYIAGVAQPGYWISNKDVPEKSLQHLALDYLKDQGYDRYFIHGIGHFLGMDVHDVGDYKEPLKEGDVITIEPGIYIPEEQLGIRIEDNYWITSHGAVCMSEDLPREPHEIEEFMAGEFEE